MTEPWKSSSKDGVLDAIALVTAVVRQDREGWDAVVAGCDPANLIIGLAAMATGLVYAVAGVYGEADTEAVLAAIRESALQEQEQEEGSGA